MEDDLSRDRTGDGPQGHGLRPESRRVRRDIKLAQQLADETVVGCALGSKMAGMGQMMRAGLAMEVFGSVMIVVVERRNEDDLQDHRQEPDSPDLLSHLHCGEKICKKMVRVYLVLGVRALFFAGKCRWRQN